MTASLRANIGETFWTVIREQYRVIREGDRFYYQNTENGLFTPSDLALIKSTTLANVIERNTAVTNLQCAVMAAGPPCAGAPQTSSPISNNGSTTVFTVFPGSPGKGNPSYQYGPTYSWYINGLETPVLYMTSGVSYTFNVQSQTVVHGFIITLQQYSSTGTSQGTNVIMGGSGQPLVYTPDIARDGTVMWYNCNQHPLMGNKIMILPGGPPPVDSGPSNTGGDPGTKSTPAGASQTGTETSTSSTTPSTTPTTQPGKMSGATMVVPVAISAILWLCLM